MVLIRKEVLVIQEGFYAFDKVKLWMFTGHL